MNQLNQHLNRKNSDGVPAEIRETYHDQYGNARNDVNGFVYGEKDFDPKGDYGNIYIATENKDGTATTEYERLATLIHELGHTYYLEETAKIDLEQNPNQSLNEYVENAMYAEGLAEYFKNQVYSELSNEFRQEAGFEISPNYDPNKSAEENAKQLAKEYSEKIAGSPEQLKYQYQYAWDYLRDKGLLPKDSENWTNEQKENYIKLFKLFNYDDVSVNLDDFINKIQDWLGDKVSFSKWFDINRSGKFHVIVYDPLVLDLDGDGVELISENNWNGVLFYFNGNGIKTATQWVSSDDGLLVWDRNGNGKIDNGSELFGEDTIKISANDEFFTKQSNFQVA